MCEWSVCRRCMGNLTEQEFGLCDECRAEDRRDDLWAKERERIARTKREKRKLKRIQIENF